MMNNITALNNETNETNNAVPSTFNCLIQENVSSVNITDPSHWRIREELLYGTPYVATVILIFFLLSFFWNLFIIITYFVKYRLLKEPANIFLLNLAFADLLVALTTMLFSIVTEIVQEFVFGSTDVVRCGLCNFAGVFLIFLIAVSLHMLAVLSVDRFILLTWPLRYKRIMNKWKAIVIVIVVWIIAILIALPPVFGFGQNEFNRNFGACLPRFTGTNPLSGIGSQFYAAFVALEALIPILVLAFTNVWTYRLVAKFLKKNITRRRTFRGKGSGSDEERKYHSQQRQLVRVFGALFISNIISWTPVLVVVFLIFFISASVLPREIYIFGWICYLTNPVVHPIIESFFVKDLRYQIRRAKKTVRRASSAVYRQSTRLFNRSALEEANAKMDKEEAGGKKQGRKFMFLKEQGRLRSEMDTEMVSMDESTMIPTLNTPDVPRRLNRKITFSDEHPPGHVENNCAKTPLNDVHEITAAVIEEDVEEEAEAAQSPLRNGRPSYCEHAHVDSIEDSSNHHTVELENGVADPTLQTHNHVTVDPRVGTLV